MILYATTGQFELGGKHAELSYLGYYLKQCISQ